MANPFPFVSGSVLLASELNGIGEVTAYTPTFTNVTVGNGTLDFDFIRVQKLVVVRGSLTFGSTTSVAGQISFTLPVTAAASVLDTQTLGFGTLADLGIGFFYGIVRISGSNAAAIRPFAVSGTNIVSGVINATTPFTWTTGDSVFVHFYYEAA